MSVSISSTYSNVASANASHKLYVPVSKSAVLYSHFDHVSGFVAKNGQGGVSISKIQILNTLIDHLSSIKSGKVPEILKEYFTTGKAPGTLDLADYSEKLLNFLAGTKFRTRNTILLSHDIICAALLLPQKVYPFKLDDWCGYIQGAALLITDDTCHLHYIVPSAEERQKSALFV